MEILTPLTRADHLFNAISALAGPLTLLSAVQWTILSWVAQWRHCKARGRKFVLRLPKKLSLQVVQGAPGEALATLWSYGINNHLLSQKVISTEQGKAVHLDVLVGSAQWEMADSLLCQHNFEVLSEPGSKRGTEFGEPWGVGAKPRGIGESVDMALGKTTGYYKLPKLGKGYRKSNH